MKKRYWSSEYESFGFSRVCENGVDQPFCIICCSALSNDSLRPSRLKKHLKNVHKFVDGIDFTRKVAAFKKKLKIHSFYGTETKSLLKSSYEISKIIARCNYPYNSGETLVKPILEKMFFNLLNLIFKKC